MSSVKWQDGRGGAGKTRPQEDQGIRGALQPKEVIGHEPSRECDRGSSWEDARKVGWGSVGRGRPCR